MPSIYNHLSHDLRIVLAVVAASLIACFAAVAPASAQRAEYELSTWKFRYGDVSTAASGKDYDDRDWNSVQVPHTWNRIGEYSLQRSDATNNAQGTGWYRLWLDAPTAPKNWRQYLDFAAVGTIADVWVNGQHVGQHKGAFSRFRIDVTDAWTPGAANLIVVRADNSKPAVGSSTENVIPLAGDFFVNGGIYRPATLIQLPPKSIDPLDLGGPGVYARALSIGDERAQVEVTTRLRSFIAKGRPTLWLSILDADGNIVSAAQRTIAAGVGQTEVRDQLVINDPRLWNGRQDPYLYTVRAVLKNARGRVLDSVSQPLGLRSIRVDADAGFFLNGEHLKLKGVSRHQDWLGSGWALSREQHRKDMELIAEMGANSVRQAHYQHDDYWSDLADEFGMSVWAELAYVGAPSLSGGKGSPELWANAEQQLRELIRQNYNHPSIMMWSIGNEVDSAKAFGATEETPSPIQLLSRLEEVAKEEDPHRPTVFADFSEQLGDFGKRRQPMTGIADLIGYNRYVGWYMLQGPMAGRILGGMLDKLHAANPTAPMSVSEYGAGGAPTQHSDDVENGYVSFAGRPQPEEYQSWVHELNWPALAQRDYVFGSWVWNMFDFPSDLRNEGDSVDINTKGLVTFDRKVKKDAFYYYQAAWTDEPMIHLTGKRYYHRSYPVMTVKAYTNASSARLTFNGEDLGVTECPNFTCEWKNVAVVTGRNDATVETVGGTASVRDTATWDGPDLAANGIRIDAGNLAATIVNGHRYGSDTFVTGGKPMPRDRGRIGNRTDGTVRNITASLPALFDFWRQGESFTYAIPVPDGSWNVALRLVALGSEDGATDTLSVKIDGRTVINSLDVAGMAGGIDRELVRHIPVQTRGGVLTIEFASPNGSIGVGAIDVLPR